MVTRNDVAKRANVSPAVVSYVINGNNYVSEEKRAAVLKAIDELKYIPNRTARSLKKNKSYQIAVLRGSVLNDMFNDLLHCMERLAYEKGYTISLLTVIRDENMIARDSFIEDLIGRQFDAIFVANSSLQESQINRLASYGISVLLYSTRDYEGLDERIRLLSPNYRAGVQLLMESLIERGHRRIGFIQNMYYPNMYTRSNHRFDAYATALENHGIDLNPSYIFGKMSDEIDAILQQIVSLFQNPSLLPPTALYADESVVIGLVLKQLQSIGIRVPEDVSLVGSSHSTISGLLSPRITSVGIEPKLLAKMAVEMMVEMIAGNTPQNCLMEMNFTEGESVSSVL
ncbi:MAG: LacI family DNA-binding transcriptional regulator [Oscillospiraceae bacterium]